MSITTIDIKLLLTTKFFFKVQQMLKRHRCHRDHTLTYLHPSLEEFVMKRLGWPPILLEKVEQFSCLNSSSGISYETSRREVKSLYLVRPWSITSTTLHTRTVSVYHGPEWSTSCCFPVARRLRLRVNLKRI